MNWDNLISLKEASELVGSEESTLRRAISSGKLIEGVDCKKFGKQCVILRDNLLKIYSK